MGNSPSQNWD